MTLLSCLALLLAACDAADFMKDGGPARGTIGFVSGALGVISVDEPQAALIARDILSAGGSAADAATAIGFALAVTKPSAASLGGGGVCIARDARGDAPVVFDFLPRAPARIDPAAARPNAVPGNPRGLFLVHARFGELPWEQVISPAEQLARFGFNMPRALAVELEAVAGPLLADPEAARVFRGTDGQIVDEGDFLIQPDLAATLGRMRKDGVGAFYAGATAHAFVDAAAAAGGSLTVEDLRGFRPLVRAPISFDWESNTRWHFAGPPAAGGAVAAEMLAILLNEDRFENAEGALREHLLAEAAKRAFADRMRHMGPDGGYDVDPATLVAEDHVEGLARGIDDDRATPFADLVASPVDWPETPAAVSFAVMDIQGGAVACTLTMNNSFGTGRMAPGFGIMLAAAPDSRGRTYTPVGPVLLTSELRNRVYMAAAASGGVAAPTALVNVIVRAAAGPQTLGDAMAAPRTHFGGVPDTVFVEAEMPAEVVEALGRRGHTVKRTPRLGRVAAAYCPTGIPARDGVICDSAADPRGHGVALGGM